MFSFKDLSKRKVLLRTSIFIVGYILSPASWWNDLFVNIPLAYIFAEIMVSFLGEKCFPLLFSIGYALTNIVGVVLMKLGLTGINKTKIHLDLALTIIYSIVAYIVLEVFLNG